MADDRPAFPYKTPPFGDYQRDILRASAALKAAYLALEQGTGKSWILTNTLAYLWLTRRITGAVITAPKGVHTAWVEEQLPAHMPDLVPYAVYLWESRVARAQLNKAKQQEWKLAERRAANAVWQLTQQHDRLAILVVNNEALTLPTTEKAVGTMLTQRVCLLACDEAGDFTNVSAARTRAILKWRTRAPYRRMLEGVPVGTSPFELYAPYKFLDSSVLGYRTLRQMQDAHAEWLEHERQDGRGFRTIKQVNGVKQYKDLDVLAKKIAPITFRVTKREALPFLPPKQYHKVYFDLTEEQWRLTTELREQLTATLASGDTVTVANVLTQYLRYQQITCGYVPPDIVYGEETEPIAVIPGPNPRLEACVDEVLRYAGRPTIIWTRFQFDVKILRQRLTEEGLRVVTYDGNTPDADREAALRDFRAGEARVFIGNPAAGGRGLNLQVAQHEIFYANYFGLRRRLQAEDRGHRIGSSTTEPVTICDIVGHRSIDVTIVRALRNNRDVADVVNRDPYQEWI